MKTALALLSMMSVFGFDAPNAGATSAGSDWEAVPPQLREHAKALGVTTIWSALDWASIMCHAVDKVVSLHSEGDSRRDAELRERLRDRIEQLDVADFDPAISLGVSTGCHFISDVLAMQLASAIGPPPGLRGGGDAAILDDDSGPWPLPPAPAFGDYRELEPKPRRKSAARRMTRLGRRRG